MPIVRLDNVSLSYGLKPLLDHVSLQIRKGERVCLLGRNGEGKSSLLHLITRQIVADSGDVWVRPGRRVASLAQEVSAATDTVVRDVVLSGASDHAGEEDWQLQLQADQVMSRLDLNPDAPMSALSGGWRRRAMLGRALVSTPDLLLLDEPTNHLDINAIVWLENMMMEFAGALLFVSHDRAFVRRVATRIVELDRGQLRDWPGSFDDYVKLKAAALETEAKHAALFDKKLAQEEVWIRQGVEARRTRNEGRVRALEQLRRDRASRRDRIGQVDMQVQAAALSGKLVFEAEHLDMSFGGAGSGGNDPAAVPVIRDFSVRIQRGDRIGIIGPNGCGKTTLIKLLVGELEPTAGAIKRGTKLQIAYFDQQRDQLNPQASIMDNVTGGSGDSVIIEGKARHVSGYLRDFLFPPERLQAPVSMLSGGERNRLLLARLFARPSNLLVMDEPTNDLDADTLDLLEEMVSQYTGTLLLVSHDRAFLDNVVTSTLVFEGGGRIGEYVGGYADWLRQTGGKPGKVAQAAPSAADAQNAAARSPGIPPPTASPTAVGRRLSYKEQRELAALPETIQRLEREQSQVQSLLNDPDHFKRSPAAAAADLQRLNELAVELEAAYSRWDSLESLKGGQAALS
jgi:ATP-binding cassette subfamily F protein uup